MKATDFMVGDWLRTSRGTAKVIAVDKIGLTFKIDGGDFDIDRDDEEEWFDAIPLTPEILEKNGFRYNDTPFVQGWEQFGLTLYRGGDGYLINCGQNVAMKINAIHELQHALRLCGIEKEITLN